MLPSSPTSRAQQEKIGGPLHARVVLFYVSLSPVFLAPILFVYLERELGLAIKTVLQLSALYGISTLFLDIPLGVIADRYGAKTTLFGGLFCYIGGIAALLALPAPQSYHLYFLLTMVGYPCTTGADIALIRQQAQETEPGEFKRYFYNLQRWSYVLNALFHLLSPVFYQFNRRLPFYLQIALLTLSIVNLITLRDARGRLRRRRKVIGDFALCLRLCRFNRKYLMLVTCSAIFNLGISINHKVIQHQLLDYIAYRNLGWLGVIFALASLCSATGSSTLANRLRRISLNRQITSLLALLIISFLAMGIRSLSTVIVGFLLVNLFKGGYRPLINAELTNQMPFQRLTAQALSIASCASALLAHGMQWLLSQSYGDAAWGNLIYALLAGGLVLAALVYSNLCYTWTAFERRSRSGKKSALICTNGRFRFLQFYPPKVELEHFRQLKWINTIAAYPTPPITWHFNFREVCVEMPFLGDIKLGDLRDPARQLKHCRALLLAFRCCKGPDRPAPNPSAEQIFDPFALEQLTKSQKLNRSCIIHGALEPEHVIVLNADCYVIDWNRSGWGPWWWDALTLITHPHLHIAASDRIDLLRHFSHPVGNPELCEILTQFCHFRARSTAANDPGSARGLELSRRYSKLAETFTSLNPSPFLTP